MCAYNINVFSLTYSCLISGPASEGRGTDLHHPGAYLPPVKPAQGAETTEGRDTGAGGDDQGAAGRTGQGRQTWQRVSGRRTDSGKIPQERPEGQIYAK